MENQYSITGMTCSRCVTKVKNELESIPNIMSAQVQLMSPEAVIVSNKKNSVEHLQHKLQLVGNYTIKELFIEKNVEVTLPEMPISTYKPLILIVSFIAGVTFLVQFPFDSFSTLLWMRYFMAGFFIVFAFFKFLNLKGFASSYRMYDIVAAKWNGWGYIYPFAELTLGILYLLHIAPYQTNVATVIVLGISSIGVIKSNLNKKKIKCACLGDVFNLPMSTVTIVEDLTMVAMAGWMLIAL